MCSTSWVFVSKLQMPWLAQRQTSPEDLDRGEGRKDLTAACQWALSRTQEGRWIGDHRPLSTNPASAIAGSWHFQTLQDAPWWARGLLPLGVSSLPAEMREVPAQPSTGLACLAIPEDGGLPNSEIKGRSPEAHLPWWASWWHGWDSHPAFLAVSTPKSQRRQGLLTATLRQGSVGGPSTSLWCPPTKPTSWGSVMADCDACCWRGKPSPTHCVTLGVCHPLSQHHFSHL